MFCTNCGRPMEENQEICNFCKDLPELKFNYCQYCGEKIVGKSSVCSQCEQKIKRKQNHERNTAITNEDENDETSIKSLTAYVKKRSLISIVLWLVVTTIEIVLVVLFNKIYPFYVVPVLNLYFIINSIKYLSSTESNIENVINNMKKKSENFELFTVFMLVIGIIVGGLPAYYDLKTIKKSILDANGII